MHNIDEEKDYNYEMWKTLFRGPGSQLPEAHRGQLGPNAKKAADRYAKETWIFNICLFLAFAIFYALVYYQLI